jgi:carbohydrate diacid regulator
MMRINDKVAQRIVESLREVIQQNINFINHEGIIVASSDEARIGTFHSASPQIFKEGKKVYVTGDKELEGTKEGVNMPVYFEGEIVGVIGITGSVDEVSKYDEIIRAMTESLVYQSFLKTQNRMKSDLKRQVFKQLLMYPDTDLNTIVGKGKVVDLNIENFERVIVASISDIIDDDVLEQQVERERLYRKFKYALKARTQAETSLVDDVIICLITDVSDEELNEILMDVYDEVNDEKIKIGVGTSVSTFKRLILSYQHAIQSLNVAKNTNHGSVVVFYNNLDIEILLKELPEKAEIEFVERVFKGVTDKELEQFVETLEFYFECNGSINDTASKLFIHKNTLQYRLNKIAERTGYNPRNMEESFILFIAVRLFNALKAKL